MQKLNPNILKKLYQPTRESTGEQNGQVTIVGGSNLFHGAPILSLKVASRIVDMVFFSSPEPRVGKIAENIKSKLSSFIWIPWDETDKYIEKSNAVLIGPGLMRYKGENVPESERNYTNDEVGRFTRELTETLLNRFPEKKWVIDAGSLQVIEPNLIPKGSIVTPNKREFEHLFGDMDSEDAARKYSCTIIKKGSEARVSSPEESVLVDNGNAGLTKGGVGDVLAGLTVALFAKNDAFLAASAATYLTQKAADELYKSVGTNYNADDLADKIPEVVKDSSI